MEAKIREIVGSFIDPVTGIYWALYEDGDVLCIEPDDNDSWTTYLYLPLGVFSKIYQQAEPKLKEAFAKRFNLPLLS